MSALLYGLNAGLGFSPHTFGMVMKTVVGGRKKGLIFLLSGLTFDLILILAALSIQKLTSGLSIPPYFPGMMQIISGFMVIRLGFKSFKARPNFTTTTIGPTSTWKEGLLIQMFNHNPYMFWFLIGVPSMFKLNNFVSALQFALLFLFTTYGLKGLMVEFCTRLSDPSFLATKRSILLRKSVATLTMINGFYLILKISVA